MNIIMTPAKAGWVVYDEMEPDAHPPHCQPSSGYKVSGSGNWFGKLKIENEDTHHLLSVYRVGVYTAQTSTHYSAGTTPELSVNLGPCHPKSSTYNWPAQAVCSDAPGHTHMDPTP